MSLLEIGQNENSWSLHNCRFSKRNYIDLATIVCGIIALIGFALIRAYPAALTTELGKLKGFFIMSPLVFGLFGIVNITCVKIWSIRQRHLFYNSKSEEWQETRIRVSKEFLEKLNYNVIMKDEKQSESEGAQTG